MKNLRSIIAVVIFLFFAYSQAQNVTYNGKEYTVKNDKIYFEDKDITATLTVDQITNIKNRLNENLTVEKRINLAEKKQKQAEKKQKQAERELKRMRNEESALASYQKKYQKELKQHEKLKKKGKLTPVDEEKWQKKLKTLEEKIEKSKKRLNRY